MKAIVMTDFHRLEVRDVPTPKPAAGEVLVRIAATGICGSDVHGYTGENGRRVPGQIMGHESAGTVAAVGAEVDPERFPVGSPVTFNPVVVPEHLAEKFRGREQHCPEKTVLGVTPDVPAAFAEFMVVPARNIVALDPGFPVELGALIEPLAVALHAVRRIGAGAGQSSLVIGGGPIGQSVVLALQIEGVEQIALAELQGHRRELCGELGATVLDAAKGDAAKVDAAAGVRGAFGDVADIAIDAVGLSATLDQALQGTKFGSRVCLVGMGAPELNVNAFAVSTEERSIVGSFTYSAQDFADAAAWAAAHPERMSTLVSQRVSPSGADQAFAEIAAGRGPAGKIIVEFAPDDVAVH